MGVAILPLAGPIREDQEKLQEQSAPGVKSGKVV